MRILHVIPTYVPAYRHGGPVRAVDGLARAQVQLGHQVTVFTTHRDGPGVLDVPTDRAVKIGGVEVFYFPLAFPKRIDHAPALAREMARSLSGGTSKFDIVNLHSVFLWPTFAAARAAQSHGVPYVISPRGMLVQDLVRRRSRLSKRLWIAMIERRNLEHAAAIHCTSTLEASEIRRFGFNLRGTFVVPNGVDLPPASTHVAATHGGPRLLFLGRLSWKKGLDLLLDGFLELTRDHPAAKLVLAGPDDERLGLDIDRRAVALGLIGNVSRVGQVDDAGRDQLFASSDLLVLPSRSENFGNVVIEAMAAGLPVVVTPGVGAAPLVLEAGAGRVAEPNPAALAEAMRAILAGPTQRAAMGEAGRRFVVEHLTWPKVAAAMVDAYRGVLAAQAQPFSPSAAAR